MITIEVQITIEVHDWDQHLFTFESPEIPVMDSLITHYSYNEDTVRKFRVGTHGWVTRAWCGDHMGGGAVLSHVVLNVAEIF
jgi:hypothetical protein